MCKFPLLFLLLSISVILAQNVTEHVNLTKVDSVETLTNEKSVVSEKVLVKSIDDEVEVPESSTMPEEEVPGFSKIAEDKVLGLSKIPETPESSTMPEEEVLGFSKIPEDQILGSSKIPEAESPEFSTVPSDEVLGSSTITEDEVLGSPKTPEVKAPEASTIPSEEVIGSSRIPEDEVLGSPKTPEVKAPESSTVPSEEALESLKISEKEVHESSKTLEDQVLGSSKIPEDEPPVSSTVPSDDVVELSNIPKDVVPESSKIPEVEKLTTPDLSESNVTFSSNDYLSSVNDSNFYADYDPADYYDDYDAPITVDYTDPELYAYSRLQKCRCQFDEIWTGQNCTKSKERLYISVLNQHLRPIPVYTEWLEMIITKEVKCSKRELKITFHGGDFHLLPNMNIFHMSAEIIVRQGEYCVSHVLDKDGALSWQAEVCLPPPNVPRCCNENQLMNYETNECTDSYYDFDFFPTVSLPRVEFKYVNSEVNTFNCTENDQLQKFHLNPVDAHLVYTGSGTFATLKESPGSPTIIRDFDHYCVAPIMANGQIEYFVQTCHKDPVKEHLERCKEGTCIRKCCQPSELYDVYSNNCERASQPEHLWEPKFYEMHHHHLNQTESPSDLRQLSGRPLCTNYFLLYSSIKSDDKFYLMANGSLHVPIWNNSISPTNYCIDNWQYEDDTVVEHAMVCFPKSDDPLTFCEFLGSYVYPVFLTISCIFLAITLGVYAAVTELRAKVHGKSLLAHVSSLLIAYISLIVDTWATELLPMNWCIILGSVIHISFLATFFWLNVMCFDIFWTLRSVRPIPESGEGSMSRFKWYSLYAWGCPAIIGFVTIFLQRLDPEVYPNLTLPGFGVKGCFFAENAAKWYYFYSFVLILTIINSIFFINVACILLKAQRATKNILKRASNRQDKERVKLYAKLFCVMGITWIGEVISFQAGSCYLWVIFDVTNAMQGTFIFLIFVCKKNVYTKLRAKMLPPIARVKRTVRTTSSYNSSQMSQRTTQSTLDSIRMSSLNHQPSLLKLSNSLPEQCEKESHDNCGDDCEEGSNEKAGGFVNGGASFSTILENPDSEMGVKTVEEGEKLVPKETSFNSVVDKKTSNGFLPSRDGSPVVQRKTSNGFLPSRDGSPVVQRKTSNGFLPSRDSSPVVEQKTSNGSEDIIHNGTNGSVVIQVKGDL